MARGHFNHIKGKLGLSALGSDILALGMITFEVRNAH